MFSAPVTICYNNINALIRLGRIIPLKLFEFFGRDNDDNMDKWSLWNWKNNNIK